MNTSNLLDAIRIVKENEKVATETYANAAKRIPATRTLFEQLSEFEKFHYVRLSALEKSLEEKGGFIDYEGKEFVLPPRLEVKFADAPDQQSVMQVISDAIKIERVARKAYADLAAQLTDPQGHKMFIMLSEEERNHFFILLDAYWSLNETGVWKGPNQ